MCMMLTFIIIIIIICDVNIGLGLWYMCIMSYGIVGMCDLYTRLFD